MSRAALRRFSLLAVAAAGGFVILRGCLAGGADGERPPAVDGDRQDPAHTGKAEELGASLSPASPGREALSVPREDEERGTAGPRFITGLVTERSGTPVAAAECLLRAGVSASGFDLPAPSAPPLARVLSNEDGTFQLEAGPGFWNVAVHRAGFARWERDHLVAGDALVVRLDPEVQLLVSVIGPAGEPVADAEIVVRDADEVAPEAVRCRMRSDPGGRAWTADLAPGSWLLTVRHPGYGVGRVTLVVPPGRFALEQEVRLERGTRVVGTVRSAAGAPISGARVRLESPYLDGFLLEEATSDASGRYATPAIFSLQETLEILVQAPGHAEATTFVGVQAPHVRAGEIVVDFELPASGRTVLGRAVTGAREGVSGAAVRIAALDPIGSSPEDVLAALQAAPSDPWLWQEVARTDEAGRFELRDLASSPQYVLLVVRDPFAPRMAFVPPGAAGATTELGELELLAWGSLFGRAIYADGSPAEGATLFILRENRVIVTPGHGRAEWRPESWFMPRQARVREDGFFRFESLAPGVLEFMPPASGSWEVGAGRAVGPVEVVLPGREPGDADVELTGVVRDRAGQPVGTVFVRVFALAGASDARLVSAGLANPDGAFSVRVPAREPSRLRFTALHGQHEEQEVLLQAGASGTPLEVVLAARESPLAPVEGLVLGPRGEPVEGCAVRLHPPEDSLCACISFQTRTDAAGAFRFEHLSAGPHRIVAADPRFASEFCYPVRPGDHVVIDLADP